MIMRSYDSDPNHDKRKPLQPHPSHYDNQKTARIGKGGDRDLPPRAIHPPGAKRGEKSSIHAAMRAESRFLAYEELERW